MPTFNISTGLLLVFTLFSALIYSDDSTNDYQRREYSLSRPYYDGRWDFVGSTIVTNNYVRLTSDAQSKQGSIWNSIPVNVHNWELHIQFKIHGNAESLFGDGMALWYTKDRMEQGSAFGNKDYFRGLAIFLDTYSNHNGPHNHQHPYVSAMINNGSTHYDHDRDGTHTEIAGCESNFRGVEHETFLAVRFENNVLTVSTDVEGENRWKECFSVKGVNLPTGYYFGASASTGELADNHDIVSLKMYELDNEAVIMATTFITSEQAIELENLEPSSDIHSPEREHLEDPPVITKGAWLKRIGYFAMFSVIAAILGIAGYMYYQTRQQNSRKRFY